MNLFTVITLEIIALVLEAFFSGSEMALMSADKVRLKKLANDGSHGAKNALELANHPEKVLITSLVGTGLCITFQSALITLYLYTNHGPAYEHYAALVLAPVALLFGELLPKTLFQRYSETIAPLVAGPMKFVHWLFTPVTAVLGKYTAYISKTLQPLQNFAGAKTRINHREELSYLLTHGRAELSLKSSERTMIRRILDFSKADATRALIPLVKLDMIEDTMTQAEALQFFLDHKHSRIPVYRERVDNVIGVLHVFDLFAEPDPNKAVSKIMQQAFYAPESQQLDDLLFTMKKRGTQMAIVVDEYGGAVGALTLEDIMEQIVGEISDEYDKESELYKKISDTDFIVSARIRIDSLNDALQLDLPKSGYETLAGFLLQQFNRIPELGDELFYKDLKFVIRKGTARSIETVQITRITDRL